MKRIYIAISTTISIIVLLMMSFLSVYGGKSIYDEFYTKNKIVHILEYSENYKIIIENKQDRYLGEKYSEEIERLYCIKGVLVNNTYKISELSLLAEGNNKAILFLKKYECQGIGYLHTHPKGSGSFSISDIYAFSKLNENNNKIFAISWGDDYRFLIYEQFIGIRLLNWKVRLI